MFDMGKVEILEKEIEALTPDELREFRRWFVEYDSALWDQKIEEDLNSGKLDSLASEALNAQNAHQQGKSKKL